MFRLGLLPSLDCTLTLRVTTTARRRRQDLMPSAPTHELVRVIHRGAIIFEMEDAKEAVEGAGYRAAGYTPGKEWFCPHPDHEKEAA